MIDRINHFLDTQETWTNIIGIVIAIYLAAMVAMAIH